MSLILLNLPAPPASPAPARQVRPRASSSSHSGSRGRRAAAWQASSAGPNDIAQLDLELTRNRSRLASRNSAYGGNAIDSLVANLIGTGIKPLSQHPDAKIREAIHTAWRRWTDQADFDGRTDLYGLQSLATRTMVEAGEVLVRFRLNPKGEPPFQIELLEPDHLPVYLSRFPSGDLPKGHRVVCGVEIDGDGRRQAYHLLRSHPNESHAYAFTGATETVRIPASEMLHIFHCLRPKEIRGTPWLGRVLWKLYQLDTYDDAELTRKQIAASITGFIMGSPQEGAPLLDVQPGMGSVADAVAQVEPERHIVALRVLARNGERFTGTSVRQSLQGEGFVHGDMQIFHRSAGDGRTLLSAASLTMPGSFDLATMDAGFYRGLNLFAVLPGPLPGRDTVDKLLLSGHTLAQRLRGDLLDSRGEPLTESRLAEMRREAAAADPG